MTTEVTLSTTLPIENHSHYVKLRHLLEVENEILCLIFLNK